MTKVKNEMTRRVVFALETDDISAAANSMRSMGIRHLPVTREGRVVGMLSDRDLLAYSHKTKSGISQLPSRPVSEVMSAPVYSCRENDSIGKVADLMLDHKIDSVAVIEPDGKLIGIITSTDLIRLLRDQQWSTQLRLPSFAFERVPLFATA